MLAIGSFVMMFYLGRPKKMIGFLKLYVGPLRFSYDRCRQEQLIVSWSPVVRGKDGKLYFARDVRLWAFGPGLRHYLKCDLPIYSKWWRYELAKTVQSRLRQLKQLTRVFA